MDYAAIKRASLILRCLCVAQIVGAGIAGYSYREALFGPSPGYAGISLFGGTWSTQVAAHRRYEPR